MSKVKFIYDDVPYPSFAFPQTNPDQLAALAAFHGMEPAAPENCRLLELGCGDGSNLLSFAATMPGSEFVGIDLSGVHIDAAKKAALDLGIPNSSFHCADVADVSREEFGEFDFIIAHGLFSWVPDGIRKKILDIYSTCLTQNGVGYISYNVYPGSHIREMVWGMMKYRIADDADSLEKVRQGTSFLKFVTEAAPEPLHKALLNDELSRVSKRPAENIFHDDLAELNRPFYFNEFTAQLDPAGLQFLCEADPKLINYAGVSDKARRMLDALGDNVLRREQYFDFINLRRFRQTLVCRGDIALRRDPKPDILNGFLFSTRVRPESPEAGLADDAVETFVNAKGISFQTNHSLTKAALAILYDDAPRRVPFTDLIQRSKECVAFKADGAEILSETEKTVSFLQQLFYSGFISLHKFQPEIVNNVSPRPVASDFARRQVKLGSETVMTPIGTSIKLDDKLAAELVLLLDGTRELESLTEEMRKRTADTQTDQEPAEILPALERLAKLGLLVA
jgi:methyltransferase-like protein